MWDGTACSQGMEERRFPVLDDSRTNESGANEDEFITGDPGSPQMLETYVQVRWRVADPLRFYSSLSHSDFFEKSETVTRAVPITKPSSSNARRSQ